MKQTKLPKKLWQLMEAVMADFKSVVRDKNYKINMDSWHLAAPSWHEDSPCKVCLAGAYMARSLDARIDCDILPSHYPNEIAYALISINHIRRGGIEAAVGSFWRGHGYAFVPDIILEKARKIEENLGDSNVDWNEYHRRPFYKYMTTVIKLLKQKGL